MTGSKVVTRGKTRKKTAKPGNGAAQKPGNGAGAAAISGLDTLDAPTLRRVLRDITDQVHDRLGTLKAAGRAAPEGQAPDDPDGYTLREAVAELLAIYDGGPSETQRAVVRHVCSVFHDLRGPAAGSRVVLQASDDLARLVDLLDVASEASRDSTVSGLESVLASASNEASRIRESLGDVVAWASHGSEAVDDWPYAQQEVQA